MPQGPSYGYGRHIALGNYMATGCKRIGCEKIGCDRVGDERIGCERIGVDLGFGIRDVVRTYDPAHPAVGDVVSSETALLGTRPAPGLLVGCWA